MAQQHQTHFCSWLPCGLVVVLGLCPWCLCSLLLEQVSYVCAGLFLCRWHLKTPIWFHLSPPGVCAVIECWCQICLRHLGSQETLGVIKGFKAFCCQMELLHELGRYHPDLELPDRFGLHPSACDASSRHCTMREAVLGCLEQHPVIHLRLRSK